MGYGGKMDGCGQFMKYSMFIINFITFIGGFILLGIGIWMLVDKSHINELLGTNLLIGAVYIMIVTGALVTIISCFGCIGSSREVRCMLLMYFFIVFVIFVTMLVGGILGFVFRKTVSDTMEQEMISSLRWYKSKRIVKEAWDDTQQRLECCGVKNYLDWLDEIPNSCCREPIPGKRLPCQSAPSSITLYPNGCLNATSIYVRDHATIIGGAGIGVACLMIFGMIFSCALFKMID